MNRIRRVAEIDALVVPHRWDWAEANADAIAAHWGRRTAERPAMFNGRVLMLAGLDGSDDRLGARFFETDYANMTAWLDLGCPDDTVGNGFAMGALRSRDGSFLLGRMAGHTANAGQLYFPAGTPDLGDVTATGEVDLAGSILREITEETGLGPSDVAVSPGWTIVEAAGKLAFMREVRLAVDAVVAQARIRRFLASETRPELDEIVIASSPTDLDETSMPAFLTTFLREAWSAQSS